MDYEREPDCRFDKKPNWDIWRLIPDAKLWEAVALSLDIEPTAIERRYGSPMANRSEPFPHLGEPPELQSRLLVAQRNLYQPNGLAITVIRMGDPPRCSVSLPAFAAWARSVRWKIPRQLAKLALPNPKLGDGSDPRSVVTKVGVALNPSDDPIEKPLAERERTSLLVIIAAVATEAKIDIKMPSKAAHIIERMTEKLGARVAARTIENHLNAIPDAIERKGKISS